MIKYLLLISCAILLTFTFNLNAQENDFEIEEECTRSMDYLLTEEGKECIQYYLSLLKKESRQGGLEKAILLEDNTLIKLENGDELIYLREGNGEWKGTGGED